jgi:sulfur carrier protein
MSQMINIMVNSQPRQVPPGSTVAALIRELGLKACAAEVNQNLVPRRDHEGCTLAEGDRVELVTLVGGG